MRSSNRTVVIALAGLFVAAAASGSVAQQPVVVTVQELIQRDHRIEVPAGTEVVWGDPHFDRVWLARRAGAPAVERTAQGFRAVFSKPGTYRGAFTIAGGHRSSDIYSLIVTVTER
jgi:hypothetical protein